MYRSISCTQFCFVDFARSRFKSVISRMITIDFCCKHNLIISEYSIPFFNDNISIHIYTSAFFSNYLVWILTKLNRTVELYNPMNYNNCHYYDIIVFALLFILRFLYHFIDSFLYQFILSLRYYLICSSFLYSSLSVSFYRLFLLSVYSLLKILSHLFFFSLFFSFCIN